WMSVEGRPRKVSITVLIDSLECSIFCNQTISVK
ncbi:MAG: hypothetical protein ACI89J_001654, partial [Hyphomicrobiaceae bacterium]